MLVPLTKSRIRMRVLPAALPQNIELQNNGTVVQWRYVGQPDDAWIDLIEIDDIDVSVTIGSVTTLPAGSPATVTNSGTDQDLILDFGIPAGQDGLDGADGDDGQNGEDGIMASVVAGSGIDVNATDPANPIVAVETNLATWNGIAPSANVQAIVSAANYAAIRALLDLEAGTDFYSIAAANAAFQPLDADLTDLASRWAAASASGPASLDFHEDTDNGTNRVRVLSAASLTGDRTFTLPDADVTFSAFAVTLLDDASASAARSTLGASAVIPLSGWSPPASNYAGLDARNGHPVYCFDTSTQEAIYVYGTMPANYNGGGLTLTLPLMAASATTGTHAADAAFENLDSQDHDSDGFATAKASSATTVSGTSGVVVLHTITFSNSEIDGLAAGSRFRLRIRRDVANDTAAGDMQFVPGDVKLEMT